MTPADEPGYDVPMTKLSSEAHHRQLGQKLKGGLVRHSFKGFDASAASVGDPYRSVCALAIALSVFT